MIEESLKSLEEEFGERFLRIHRNALVARHAIRALVRHHDAEEGEGWAVRLAGVDEMLMVSRRQVAAVREALRQEAVAAASSSCGTGACASCTLSCK